jgi:hypothetical protein
MGRALEMYLHPDRLEDAALADAVLAMTARVGPDAFLSQQAAILGRPDGDYIRKIRTARCCGC